MTERRASRVKVRPGINDAPRLAARTGRRLTDVLGGAACDRSAVARRPTSGPGADVSTRV